MRKRLWMALGLLLLGGPLFAGSSIPWATGEKTWVLGVNYAWNNFGNDFSDQGYDAAKYRKDIDTMAASGVHVIRWWIFASMWASPTFSGPGKGSLCTGLPKGWVKNMLDATNYAYSKGIRIYYCILSFDIGGRYDNGKLKPVKKDDGTYIQFHSDIVDNPKIQKSFIDNALKPIVIALGKHPGVMGWDIINEPEWIVKESAGDDNLKKNDCFPLSQMRALVGNMVKAMHPYVKQPISVGSACIKWCGGQFDYWSGLGLDFFDAHYYDWMTPWFNPVTLTVSSLNLKDKGKPYIIGESICNPPKEYSGPGKPLTQYQMAVSLYNNGYAGYLPWAWHDLCQIGDHPDLIKADFIKFYKEHPPQVSQGK